MKRTIVVGLIAILLILPSIGLAAEQQGEETTPPARSGHTLVTIDGDVYLFGGEGSSSGSLFGYSPNGPIFNDLWRLEGNEWKEETASNPPPARRFHKAVEVGGKMYVFFGEDSQGQPKSDVWEYDPGGNTWTQKVVAAPAAARSQHSVVTINDKLYVYGGKDSNGDKRQDLWSYDTAANTWQQLANAPTSFSRHSAVVHNNQMYVHTFTQSIWRYDPLKDEWGFITPLNSIPARFDQTIFALDGKMVVVGGQDINGNEYRDTLEYNFDENNWTKKANTPVYVTQAAGAVFALSSTNSPQGEAENVERGIIFGGLSDGIPSSRTLIFDPEGAGSWDMLGEARIYLPLVSRGE